MHQDDLERRLALLKIGSSELTSIAPEQKYKTLVAVADRLIRETSAILKANRRDLEKTTESSPAFLDRLTLNEGRIYQMAETVRAIAKLEDPVGEIVESRELKNGLKIRRVRAPLGCLLVIFESRPNVITEIFALAFKSGNSVALRGGSDSRETASILYQLIDSVLAENKSGKSFVGVEDYDRDLVGRLLQRDDIFEICIPRGGSALINRVTRESRMPVIKNDKGVCHLYVHTSADIEMAVTVAINAKTQRPGVCNAIETVLVDEAVADKLFRRLLPAMTERKVHFFVCDKSFSLIHTIAKTDGVESSWAAAVSPAKDDDFYNEYLDLKINIKIVGGTAEAMSHIAKYGSHHSEAIIAKDESVARLFQRQVDSACVYWNASTRFTDGYELGLGGEIGISTQKLHVRGPVGLKELTSVRWLIEGTGQVR